MLRPGKDKGLASPIPLGLAGLAVAVFLMGVAVIFQPVTAWAPYMLEAMLFGGLIEILAGMWGFAYGDPIAATAFTFLGAFFGWWGLAHMTVFGVHAASAVAIDSVAMVFIVSAVVTLWLWVASFYEFAAMNLSLLFLWIAFGLMGIAMFTAVGVIGVIGGISALISGVISGYGSFAALYNETSMKDSVPLGESASVRERTARDEMDRIHRIHPVDHGNYQATA